jgi:hypothetical protein
MALNAHYLPSMDTFMGRTIQTSHCVPRGTIIMTDPYGTPRGGLFGLKEEA